MAVFPQIAGQVMERRFFSCVWLSVFAIFLIIPLTVRAQGAQGPKDLVKDSEAPGLSDKDKARQKESLKKELEGAYKKWLNEDVAYIITDEERKVFTSLQNDEEREQFIEQFWMRRNPDPESLTNDYKEEHYRRIAYANQHFASGIPGWKSDRGRLYI